MEMNEFEYQIIKYGPFQYGVHFRAVSTSFESLWCNKIYAEKFFTLYGAKRYVEKQIEKQKMMYLVKKVIYTEDGV